MLSFFKIKKAYQWQARIMYTPIPASPKASYDDGGYDRLRTCCKNSSQKHYRQKSMCFYKMALISEK